MYFIQIGIQLVLLLYVHVMLLNMLKIDFECHNILIDVRFTLVYMLKIDFECHI